MTERRRILERWRRSGLSADAFSVRVGVHPSSLYAWRRSMPPMQSAAAGVPARDAAGAFVELVAACSSSADSGPLDVGVEAHDQPRPHAPSRALTRSLKRSFTRIRKRVRIRAASRSSHAGVEILVQDPRELGGRVTVRLHAGFIPSRSVTLLRALDALRDSAAEMGARP